MNTPQALTQDEIQILDSALLGTEFSQRIDEVITRINNLEWINMIHAMLVKPGITPVQWREKKRLIQFFVESIFRKAS